MTVAVGPIKGNNGSSGATRARRLVRFGRRRFARLQNGDVKGQADQPEDMANNLDKNGEEPDDAGKHLPSNGVEEPAAANGKPNGETDSEDAGNELMNGVAVMDESHDNKDEKAATGADKMTADEANGDGDDEKKMNGDESVTEEGDEEATKQPDGEPHAMTTSNGKEENEESGATGEPMEANGHTTSGETEASENGNKKDSEVEASPQDEFHADKPEDGAESTESTGEHGGPGEQESKPGDPAEPEDVEQPANEDGTSASSDELTEGDEHSAPGSRRKGKAYSFAYNTSAIVEAAAAADPNAQQAPILSRSEKSDEKGNVRGSYGYMDAQGQIFFLLSKNILAKKQILCQLFNT